MRRRIVGGLAVFACSSLVAIAAGAHADLGLPLGTGGPHSANVHPLMNVPTTTGVGGAFSGHYYFQTISDPVADYAYVSPPAVGGVGVFDVSTPTKPALAGFLPLPHWQNEDVSISDERKLLLVSNEDLKIAEPGTLNVVDISTPSKPRLISSTLYGVHPPIGDRTGHTVTFLGHGRYAYITGRANGSVLAVDLRDPAKPKFLGDIRTPAGNQRDGSNGGSVHDVSTDRFGNVWMMGEGGTAMYAPFDERNPMHPKLLAAISKADNKKYDYLIHHNSIRMNKDTVLITEESYSTGNCGPAASGEGPQQDGSLQIWHIDLAHHRLTPIGRWDAPKGAGNQQGFNAASATFICSSHWFTLNSNNIVADAWYAAGVRFLDISDPTHIRQVGFYVGDSAVASQARFVPGHPDLVYVSDYIRGIDVVSIDNAGKGAKTVTSPKLTFNERQKVSPNGKWGWMCAMPTIDPVGSSLALHGARRLLWTR